MEAAALLQCLTATKTVLDLTDRFKKRQKKLDTRRTLYLEVSDKSYEQHAAMVARWSSDISVGGGARQFDVDQIFVRLRLQPGQVIARAQPQPLREIDQDELLATASHSFVLGGPGAGKTTLLKYLARRLLTCAVTPPATELNFPVVVECRDLRDGEGLFARLADVLGITIAIEGATGIAPRDEGDAERFRREVIIDMLAERPALLLIDALDEVSLSKRQSLCSEIEWLCMRSPKSTVVVTCRYGAIAGGIAGMRVLGVREFNGQDVREFCSHWFGKDSEKCPQMLEAVNRATSYQTMLQTPLHLANLCLVFDANGKLPESPINVYETILLLRLEGWDRQRRITRESSYGKEFGPQQKMRFLSAMSYRMAASGIGARFHSIDLAEAYSIVAPKHGLPLNEVDAVVREIESHTGLLVQVDDRTFEFYHLSIFEYLCAEYLSRSQVDLLVVKEMLHLPDASAIACGRAAEADLFVLHLAHHLWRSKSSPQSEIEYHVDFWRRMFTRMRSERIALPNTPISGLSLIILSASAWWNDKTSQGSYRKNPSLSALDLSISEAVKAFGLSAAVSRALKFFGPPDVRRDYVLLRPKADWPSDVPIRLNTVVAIDRLLYDSAL